MNNLKKHAANQTARLPLRDASDNPIHADGPDGQPDYNKPVVAVIYGPASSQYAAAMAAQNKRAREVMFKRGKVEKTPEQERKENAQYLASITHSIENLDSDEPVTTDRNKLIDTFADPEIGFIADQVSRFAGDWVNFSKPSPTN